VRYLAAFIVIIALSGCDRDKEFVRNGTDNGAADSQAAQTPTPSKSETLKVTFSKSDPFEKSASTSKEAAPKASASEHAGHGSKEKPGQEKKTTHEEHSKK